MSIDNLEVGICDDSPEDLERIRSAFSRILICLSGFLLYYTVVTLLNHFNSFEGIAGLVYGLVLFIYNVAALKGTKTLTISEIAASIVISLPSKSECIKNYRRMKIYE